MLDFKELTEEERKEHKRWEELGSVLVLKDITPLVKNKFHLVKAGSISTKYEFCYYDFIDENGQEVEVNIAQCQNNPDYFIPVNIKVLRKLKIKKLCGE